MTKSGSSQGTHLPTPADAKRALKRELRRDRHILVSIIAVLWLVLLVNAVFFGGDLLRFGIVPRTTAGLRGIVFAPFLHENAGHLFGNTVGLFLLGGLVLLREEADFWIVTAVGILIGGAGTWLVGHSAVHVGASGAVFAYFGYLILTGFFERRIGSILLSAGALLLWGGLLFGVLPGQPGISWEGHLFGLLGGVCAAGLLSRYGRRKRSAA
jgi:membrane associated rhomboid family serine protease